MTLAEFNALEVWQVDYFSSVCYALVGLCHVGHTGQVLRYMSTTQESDCCCCTVQQPFWWLVLFGSGLCFFFLCFLI